MDELSKECMNSCLDLFAKPPLQSNVLKTIQVAYNPITALDNSTSIEFNIPSSGKKFNDFT